MTGRPSLSIGILSWNRLHYLRATLESARRCIHYPDIEWIVVDNESTEPGLREYLEELDWIDRRVFRRLPMGDAMSLIVEQARGQVLMLWPDDMQFIVAGDWMVDLVEILMKNPWIGSLGLNCLSRRTIQRTWTWRRWLNWKGWVGEIKRHRTLFRCQRFLYSSRGVAMRTFGWTKPGIIGSGIPSLTRTEVWCRLGAWKTAGARPGDLVDSSGGGETEMLQRYRDAGLVLQRGQPIIPVAADILTDPTGTKAKVRGDKRYGVYMPPPEGPFYYHIYQQDDLKHLTSRITPAAFEEFVKPVGYPLPLDSKGNLLKDAINTSIVSNLG